MVNYWWASQGVNYHTAISQGTLWTCPRGNGSVDVSRGLIKSLQPGDVVFHHYRSRVRAVSQVTEPWRAWKRPEGYPRIHEVEDDDGWLVTVEPIRTDIELHFKRVAELIRLGPGSPLNSRGQPQQKYLSALSEVDGLSLLSEVGLSVPSPTDESLFGRPDDWGGGGTDEIALGTIRREQGDLRRSLLNGQTVALCSICGESRPAKLLIAGHIKPRSKCTEEERRNFQSVAMLICSLGCDALFEWGYIYVDVGGKVRRGCPAETDHVRDAVDLLIGKTCRAYDEFTASNFAVHAELVRESALLPT